MLSPASQRFATEPAPNRVPKVTVDFWLIKLMAVTVGETAADYLAVNLGYGLTATSLFMSAILIVALVLQFRQKRYVPWAYWLAVVLISVVGTLVRRHRRGDDKPAGASAEDHWPHGQSRRRSLQHGPVDPPSVECRGSTCRRLRDRSLAVVL